jgi:hypothetical protein
VDDLASNWVGLLAWQEHNKPNLLTELVVETGVRVATRSVRHVLPSRYFQQRSFKYCFTTGKAASYAIKFAYIRMCA